MFSLSGVVLLRQPLLKPRASFHLEHPSLHTYQFPPSVTCEIMQEAVVQLWDPVQPPASASASARPLYIYTPEGVYEVPREYVVMESQEPLHISFREWRNAQSNHRCMTAATFLKDKVVAMENFVVLNSDINSYLNTGFLSDDVRVHWFIRIAVEGGCSNFEFRFGDSFLWQIPHAACAKILGMGGTKRLGPLGPTQHDFDVRFWPKMFKVARFSDYYDCVFAMSVAPCAKPLAQPFENRSRRTISHSRPCQMQPLSSCIDISNVPYDVYNKVLTEAIEHYARADSPGDWNAFLALRGVCRDFRDRANAHGVKYLRTILEDVKLALKTTEIKHIEVARDRVLNANLGTIAFIQDVARISVLNLMRLRTGKRPQSLPPQALPPPLRPSASPRREPRPHCLRLR